MSDVGGFIADMARRQRKGETFETPGFDLNDGWIADSDTWVYVSPTSFKIVGKNVITRFSVGSKLSCTNTGQKYAYGIAAVMSGSDTLVTTAGDALVSGAITSPSYSYASGPPGFLHWFNCTPNVSQGASANIAKTVNFAFFKIEAREVTYRFSMSFTAAGTAGANVAVSLPVAISAGSVNYDAIGIGGYSDNPVSYPTFCIGAGTGVVSDLWFVPIGTSDVAGKIIGSNPSLAVASGDGCNGQVSYRI